MRKPARHIPHAQADQRLANLAMELGVAGTQVLIEQFDFTEQHAQQWFDAMLTRAQANRAAGRDVVLKEWRKQ